LKHDEKQFSSLGECQQQISVKVLCVLSNP
jgi:hypothetical protein